jgi:hypothetical protein
MRYSFGFESGASGGGGITSVATDNNTVFGDGTVANPLFTFEEEVIVLRPAQILSLGTPFELLPAPGLDFYYVIDRIEMEYQFNTTAYVFPSSATFYLDGCFDSYIINTILTGANNSVCVISGNLRNTITVGSGSGSVQVITNRDILNSNLVIGTPNGDNPINGDGALRIKIYYLIKKFFA